MDFFNLDSYFFRQFENEPVIVKAETEKHNEPEYSSEESEVEECEIAEIDSPKSEAVALSNLFDYWWVAINVFLPRCGSPLKAFNQSV